MEEMNLFSDNKNILKIGYGIPSDILFNLDLEFEEYYEPSWLNNEFNIRILKEVDNAILCPSGLCDADEQDRTFSIYEISTGSKALMICNMLPKIRIWGTIFGDNCTDLLLEIAERNDVTIYLCHLLEFNPDKFRAFSLTKQKEYENYREYVLEACEELVKDEN